jgi:subtilisin
MPNQTGRYLVLLRNADGFNDLAARLGLKMARSGDYTCGAVRTEDITSDTAMLFDQLRVAVVTSEPGRIELLHSIAARDHSILAIEPERSLYAREGCPALQKAKERPAEIGGAGSFDESRFTWGLQATNVSNSRFSGNGVRVAVLDTGLDFEHPDFVLRSITAHSFVPGQPAQDLSGHGTHCAGVACGSRTPMLPPRYGVAYGAHIFAGKVLDDGGGGVDSHILAAINWAVANQCRVVSLSFGIPAGPDEGYSLVWEGAARRALFAGTLLIAAAGNESKRSAGSLAPVGSPANCPSVLAVAAVDSQLAMADFSSGGESSRGRNIAAPGADVRSSWPMPTRCRTISGASMAAPHVAGIAALHLEADPGMTGRQLQARLLQTARPLNPASANTGAKLVQAP